MKDIHYLVFGKELFNCLAPEIGDEYIKRITSSMEMLEIETITRIFRISPMEIDGKQGGLIFDVETK